MNYTFTKKDGSTATLLRNFENEAAVKAIARSGQYPGVSEKVFPMLQTVSDEQVANVANEALTQNNVKVTTVSSRDASGHAYVLHRDRKNEFHLITSTGDERAIQSTKEEGWFKKLQEPLIPVNVTSRNVQNLNQGCIFAAMETERLLNSGEKTIENLPIQMSRSTEKKMMDTAYVILSPMYKDDQLTEPKDEYYPWITSDGKVVENHSVKPTAVSNGNKKNSIPDTSGDRELQKGEEKRRPPSWEERVQRSSVAASNRSDPPAADNTNNDKAIAEALQQPWGESVQQSQSECCIIL